MMTSKCVFPLVSIQHLRRVLHILDEKLGCLILFSCLLLSPFGLFLSGWLCAVETVPCLRHSLTQTWTTSQNVGCLVRAPHCTWSSQRILPPSLCSWHCDTRVSTETLETQAASFFFFSKIKKQHHTLCWPCYCITVNWPRWSEPYYNSIKVVLAWKWFIIPELINYMNL